MSTLTTIQSCEVRRKQLRERNDDGQVYCPECGQTLIGGDDTSWKKAVFCSDDCMELFATSFDDAEKESAQIYDPIVHEDTQSLEDIGDPIGAGGYAS